jgi:hypothetical protein
MGLSYAHFPRTFKVVRRISRRKLLTELVSSMVFSAGVVDDLSLIGRAK